MLAGALPHASKHRTSHVIHQLVPARADQHLSPLQYGYPVQCNALLNGCWKEQTRRSTTSSTAGKGNVLPHIREFTTRYPLSIFRSLSSNPYHNLAIENYLLKQSEPNSRILFTYTNRPCVVFGRNQNPWLECNIAKVQEGLPWDKADWAAVAATEQSRNVSKPEDGKSVALDLVRRRSGGGTVIHDVGNLNFSFIVPNDKDFTRDKHAWLVVSVLQDYQQAHRGREGVKPLFDKVRVNERHDIVMTQLLRDEPGGEALEYKASGSAFKLTRGRALHHGTLLHSSPNVGRSDQGDAHRSTFSALLSSPVKPYLEAKGVSSVRSPVHNLFQVNGPDQRWELASDLEAALRSTFESLYDKHNVPCIEVGDEDCQHNVNKEIYDDVQEMMTDEWRFCQTPTFEYSSTHGQQNTKLQFQVKHGIIQSPKLDNADKSLTGAKVLADLEGKKLHEIQCWDKFVPGRLKAHSANITEHLATVFPKIRLASAEDRLPAADGIIEEKSARKTAPGSDVIKRQSREGNIEVEEQGENVVIER